MSAVDPPPPPTAATPPSGRIRELDVVRGAAICGILVVNIQAFAYVMMAYVNPAVQGDLTGLNYVVWMAGQIFVEFKFITLFSLLFGAGLYLLADRWARAGRRPVRAHWRRLFWLGLIGLGHAYLLWFGDILFMYAVCAAVAVLFWKRSTRTLIGIAVVLLVIPTTLISLLALSLPYWPEEVVHEMRTEWHLSPERVQEETEAYRGGWREQQPYRIESALMMHTWAMGTSIFWRTTGVMLLGMALLKLGLPASVASAGGLARRTLFFGLPGLALCAYGAFRNAAEAWDFEYTALQGELWNYWGSLPLALGYFFGLCWLVRSGAAAGLVRVLEAIGRLALTNYLMQSVIFTTVFYGHGFGLFGHVERWQQALMVVVCWGFQGAFSVWWLRRFGQGPVERLWRWLSGGRGGF